jgi:hypothetical protein
LNPATLFAHLKLRPAHSDNTGRNDDLLNFFGRLVNPMAIKRKPFDVLAEGLLSENSRGNGI